MVRIVYPGPDQDQVEVASPHGTLGAVVASSYSYCDEDRVCCGDKCITPCDPDECEACDEPSGSCKLDYNPPDYGCCDGEVFDTSRQTCCDGEVVDGGGGSCCGDPPKGFDPAKQGCCPATQPADRKPYDLETEGCCGPKALVFIRDWERCCDERDGVTLPEHAKKVQPGQACCGPTAIVYETNSHGCCGPSKHTEEPLWQPFNVNEACCEPCDGVPKTRPPTFPPYACLQPDCAGENLCCGSDGDTYDAIEITSESQLNDCLEARLRPKWVNSMKTDSNGCGPWPEHNPRWLDDPMNDSLYWGSPACPGHPLGGTGGAPCDMHDYAYGNCGCRRSDADTGLGSAIRSMCETMADEDCQDKCERIASIYQWAVESFGSGPFVAGQMQDCLCCQEP